jgi:prevent-host-death family protein
MRKIGSSSFYIANISEAKASLSKLIERVQQGEEVIIGKAGKPIAKLVPFEMDTRPRVLGGSWEGKVEMAEDFDELPDAMLEAFYGGDE